MSLQKSENKTNFENKISDQNLLIFMKGPRFWLSRIFILSLSTFLVLALMIRLTIRDSGGVISTLIYYMTPLILLSFGAAILFVLSWRAGWHRIAFVWLVLSIITGIWCANTQFQRNNSQLELKEVNRSIRRIAFWNIGDRLWGMDAVLDELRNLDADLIGLVEAGPGSAEMKQFWLNSFPDHPHQVVKNGFVCLSRVPITHHSSGTLSEMGKYERLSLKPDQRAKAELSVYLVDIKSNVLKSRKEALVALAKLVSETNDQPALVLGDFNTPSDSVHFQPLRRYLKNSFEVAGDGYMATWPLPLPVLDLDSIWVNDQIGVSHCENRWTWVSDHRPVLTEVFLR
ncbi:hypothetical protein V144x_36270 [Gimesia aquarii]|uniref:Endonuclease/exonuclease/phosphatase domain-containing protein n=2 Tax=Gimesia aquarii TaxID=2527964 RepID=A0A517VYS7_9PLAN|nr:hypothetical protein V144x_36270 [Gimesia aquarii]